MLHPAMPWLVFGLTMIPAMTCETPAGEKMPHYRIDNTGFKSSRNDIKAVCDSAGSQLWRHFGDHQLEPFVVKRGNKGPIFLHRKNSDGEMVIMLDTQGTFWAQFSYQFAHEFCHLLCGHGVKDRRNLWFEETLAETASLYAMRGMAREWKTKPPYSNWASYRDALRKYADEAMLRRDRLAEIHRIGLPAFYEANRKLLERNPTDRDLNGAMAIVLLRLFEQQPGRWEAVRWLNDPPRMQGRTFSQHLSAWKAAVPRRHKEFVDRVARLFGVTIQD